MNSTNEMALFRHEAFTLHSNRKPLAPYCGKCTDRLWFANRNGNFSAIISWVLLRFGPPVVWLLVFVSLVGGFEAGATRDSQKEVSLVEEGRSAYVIVVPDGPDFRDRVGQAAKVLQQRIEEATGARLPIVKEADLMPATAAIYLGKTKAAAKAALPIDQIRGWTFLKQCVGRDVFLVGTDAAAGVRDGYRTNRMWYCPEEELGAEKCQNIEYLGTLKAVLSFLEEEVGVRFLLPGQMHGTFVPQLKRLAVKPDLNVMWHPTILWTTGAQTQDPIYNIANNYLGNQFVWSYGGHSYYDAVPTPKYGKEHPEYYALTKAGVRYSTFAKKPEEVTNGRTEPLGFSYNDLCISNADVQNLMLKEMEKRLDAGYEWVELGQTDGYGPCQCEKCKALDPDVGERLWIVHRKLAEEMNKRRPGKKVMILAYGPTTMPPKTFTTFSDNVVIEIARHTGFAFREWAKFDVPKACYVYNWTGTVMFPSVTPKYVADQVANFAKNRVSGIYICDGFGAMGLQGPVHYVYGKMFGAAGLDYLQITDDFYRAAYGKACEPMKRFFGGYSLGTSEGHRAATAVPISMFDQMELRMNVINANMVIEGRIPGQRTMDEIYSQVFPPNILMQMEESLAAAKLAEPDPHVQARLRLVEMEFELNRRTARVLQFYHTYRLKPNWTTFELLAGEIEERNDMIDGWYDAKGNIKHPDGWSVVMGNVDKASMKAVGMYSGHPVLLWDTKKIRESKVLPGPAGEKSAI